MTAPSPANLNGTASLNVTALRSGVRAARTEITGFLDYVRQNGTLSLTLKLAQGTATALRAQVDNAVKARPLRVNLDFDPGSVSGALSALRTQLSTVVGLNLSSLTVVQAQVNTQISQLTTLISQLRALGGNRGGGTGRGGGTSPNSGLPQNTQNLLGQLEKLNNEYKRGDVSATAYAVKLAGLQSALRVSAAGATAGTTEFRALDQAVTRTVQGLRNVQSAQIVQLRSELLGARAAFDAAAAAATNLTERRAAVAAYTTELNRVRVALQGMAASGQLTAQQLGVVNTMLGRTAREANTINGKINLAGLSGNVANGVQQLSGFVPGLAAVNGLFAELPPTILAVTTALALFTAGLASSFRTAAEFQQGIADIKALTEPTAQGLEDLKRAGLDLGIPLGVGARKAAAAMLELNRAGLNATDVVEGGLVGALNLAGAAGIGAAEAGKLGTAAMTAFKLSAQDLPSVADIFANFSNKTFLGAEDLSQAIAAVGPVARTAGLELNDFSGYMATLAQGGFKQMSDAGTSLKTMLLALQAPTDTAAAAMERIGLNVYNAAGQMRPINTIIEELRTRLKGLSEQQRNDTLKDIFGTDAIRAATILYETTSEALEANIAAMGKQGEAARVARERMNTYQGAVAQLGAAWERFTITIGEKFLPVATDVVRALGSGLGVVQDFANGTRNLVPYIAPLVGAFVALRGAAIAAAAPAIWAALLTAIGTFFTTVNAWVASNPFGAIALAVSALAATVNKIMQDTQAIYDQMDRTSNDSFEATMKRVRALNQEGTELARTQAKLLLAQQALQEAQQGTVTGVNLFGERTYSVDPQKVEEARARVAALRAEIVSLNTERGRRSTSTDDGGVGVSPDRLKKQQQAVADLRRSLSERAFTLKLDGVTEMEGQLLQLGKAFDDLRIKVKAAFGGNLNNSELKDALNDLDEQRARETASLIGRQLDDQKKVRLDHERSVQQAELALLQDAGVQRRAEIEQQLEDTRTAYDEQIRSALTAAQNKSLSSGDRQQFLREAGELQQLRNREVVALERQLNQDLGRIAAERVEQVRSAQRGELEAQAKRISAGLQLLEGQRDAELALAGDVPQARLEIEQRYAPQIARLQQATAEATGRAQRSQLESNMRQELAVAAQAGTQRATLERSARQKYTDELATLELTEQRQRQQQQLAQEQRFEAQRMAIFQKGLDDRLAGAREATAAQLREMERVLQGERAAAVSQNQGGRVAAIDGALSQIGQIRTDNLKAFRQELRDSVAATTQLQEQLTVLGRTPLDAALSSVAREYNAVIEGVAAQLKSLRERSQAADLSGEDRARLQASEAALTRIQVDAARSREVAILTERQRLQREGEDRLQAQASEQAKRQFEGSGVSGPYLARLRQDEAFWTARIALYRGKGDQVRQLAAEQQLATTTGERDRVLQQDRQMVAQRLSFAREQARLDQQQASTDAERQAATLRLLALDQARAAALPGEIAAARQRGASEADLNALIREQADLRGTLQGYSVDDLARAQALRNGQQAELQLGLDLARTDQERAGYRSQLLAHAQEDLAIAAQSLDQARAEGATQERLLELEGRRAGFARTVATLQEEDRRRADELFAAQRALASAEAQRAEVSARTSAELLRLKQQGVEATAQEIAQIDAQIASASDRRLTEAQVLELLAQRVQKQATQFQQERGVRQFIQQMDQQSLALAEARARAEGEVSGALQDAVKAKQFDLDTTRRALVDVDRQLALSNQNLLTEQERHELHIRRLGLLGQEASQQRALVEAQFQARSSALDLLDAQARARAQLQGLGDDAVATAQLELELTRQRQDLNLDRLSSALREQAGQEAINGLLRDQAALTVQASQQEERLLTAQRDRRVLLENLIVAQAALDRELAGGSERARGLQAALAGVSDTRLRLVQAERAYAQAASDVQRSQSSGRLEQFRSATEALTGAISAQRAANRALADEYRSVLGSMDQVREAGERLRTVVQDGSAPRFDGNREVDRFMAIQTRRDQAISTLRQAITTGDAAAIAEATSALAVQEERYKKQADLLKKNGVQVSLTREGEVAQLADQVDRLGIEYDREAVMLQQRADLLRRESEVVMTFAQQVVGLNQDQQALLTQRMTVADREQDTMREFSDAVDRLAQAVQDLRQTSATVGRASTEAPAPITSAPRSMFDMNSDAQQLLSIWTQGQRVALAEQMRLSPLSLTATTPQVRAADHYTIVTEVGEIKIYQAPGESTDEVADRVIEKLSENARRSGRNCVPRTR